MTETGIKLAAPTVGGRVSVLAWSGLESACRQILSLLFFLGTIRFLSPADLGLFSLGVALIGILAIVIDEPIGEALLQKHTVTTADWNTGYTVNIGIAALCLVFASIASPLLANFLHQPLLVWVTPALALSSFVGAMGNIHKWFLSRELRFRTIAQIGLMAQLLAGIASIGAAKAGLGYWALVVNVLGGALATSLAFRFLTPWKPQLRIAAETVKSRQQYATYSIMIRSIYLLRDQALFVVVGTLGDLSAVGYLSLAMRIARALSQLFEEVTSRPMLSLISRQQNDLARFGDALQTVLLIIGLIAFPSFIGLAELGTSVISNLVGAQWAPAGHFLPWICAGLSGWLFLHIVAVALRARGLGRLAVCLTAPAISADVVIFFSATWIGLDCAMTVWAARALLSVPVLISVLSARLGISVRSLAQIWAAPLTSAILMVLLLRWLEASRLPPDSPLGLLALIAVGGISYGIALFAVCPRSMRNKLLEGAVWK